MFKMKMLATFSLTIFLTLFTDIESASGPSWDYGPEKGPAKWPTMFSTCSGSAQSPIDITTDSVTYRQTYLKPFNLRKESSPAGTENLLQNDGHKVLVSIKENWTATIEGDSSLCFRPVQAHWHWGSEDGKGSEHTIDGKTFPLELHVVMYNCKDYTTAADALKFPNGLAVLGILYEIDEAATVAPDFDDLVKRFKNDTFRKCCGTKGKLPTIDLPKFQLRKFLPDNINDFYRYMGSLTTPPCTQNVMWTIFKETKKIKSSQMSNFRFLQFPDGKPMVNTYRPPLPLNPESPITTLRQVSASFNSSPGQYSSFSIYTLLMSICLGKLFY